MSADPDSTPVDAGPESQRAPGDANAESHRTRIAVWGGPPAVECGAKFRVKVGVKCASECRAEGWRLEVHDHDGNALTSASAGEAPWPGTAALYYAELELRAPDIEGLYAWEARVPAIDGGSTDDSTGDGTDDGTDDRGADGGHGRRHEAARASFNVRAVPAPECMLKVVAVDARSQAPVEGAKVVVHPYRAFTDEHGVAELRVPKGEYRLFVSGPDHAPFRSDGEVQADMTIRAELDADLGPSDAELWS